MKKLFFLISPLLAVLLLFNFQKNSFATQTIQTDKTSTYTFTIKTGITDDQYDTNGKDILKAYKSNESDVVTLDSSLDGRTAELPLNTLIFMRFPKGNHKIIVEPNSGIVDTAQGKYNMPNGVISLLKVTGKGSVTIKVIEKVPQNKVTNSANTSNNWSGYARATGGPYTDVTSNWVVPTSSDCNLGDTDSSTWIGIDGAGNSNLIQTGTESGCALGNPYYQAWWEILPATETVISGYSVNAGDNMFAEVKKNSTNWTITIKNLTRNWSYSTNQSYSGSQASVEWIQEAPTIGGSIATLTHYGLATFINNTQNTLNPNHTYSTDSYDMLASDEITVISSTSVPNTNTNGFSTSYGSSAPSAPGGSWTSTGNMYMVNNHYATLLPNGKVLVSGGQTASGNPVSQVSLYDPSANTWSINSFLSTPRWSHSADLVIISGGTTKVLVAGGFRTTTLSSCELYNISSSSWSPAATMNTARLLFPTVKLSDGTILAIGGYTGYSGSTPTASVELYDPIANTWTTKTSLNTARGRHKAVLLNDGRILVVGGTGNSGALSSTELYDSSNNTWTNGPNMSYSRDNPVMALLPNGKVLVAGGSNRFTAEIFDPSNNTFSNATSMNYLHDGAMPVLVTLSDSSVRVLVASGPSYSSQVELYDYSNNIWSVTNNMLQPRRGQTATLLNNGTVLMAGGLNNLSSSPSEYFTTP